RQRSTGGRGFKSPRLHQMNKKRRPRTSFFVPGFRGWWAVLAIPQQLVRHLSPLLDRFLGKRNTVPIYSIEYLACPPWSPLISCSIRVVSGVAKPSFRTPPVSPPGTL